MAKLLIMVISYALGSFLLRLFTALGIGIFTYKGLYELIDSGVGMIQPLLSGLPSNVLDIMAIAGVPEGLSIVTSAILTRAAINAAKAFVGVVA